MADGLTCERCGTSFRLPAHLRERYPGWEPRLCHDCHRRERAGPPAPDDAPAGGARRRQARVEHNLTVAEVLERHHGGPTTGVFTDGSAVPNPGPGGWGAVYVVDDEVVDRVHGHEPDTTNNRMELRALIAGCDLVPAGTPATVYTDSRLAHDTINSWAAGWKRRGWRRKGGEVRNLDLVKAAYRRFQQRPELELRWVPAHAGYRWNEYADALATAWMREEL